MNKSITELPIPEIKTKLNSETTKSATNEKKIMYLDDLLSKIFLRTYFKKKNN